MSCVLRRAGGGIRVCGVMHFFCAAGWELWVAPTVLSHVGISGWMDGCCVSARQMTRWKRHSRARARASFCIIKSKSEMRLSSFQPPFSTVLLAASSLCCSNFKLYRVRRLILSRGRTTLAAGKNLKPAQTSSKINTQINFCIQNALINLSYYLQKKYHGALCWSFYLQVQIMHFLLFI